MKTTPVKIAIALITLFVIITVIFLGIAMTYAQTHHFSGRAIDQYGRAIKSVSLRMQMNACAPEFGYYPIEELYTYSNTFGYYVFEPRNDCLSYSIRVLGNPRYPESGFTPPAYWYGISMPPDLIFTDRTFENANFVYGSNAYARRFCVWCTRH